MAEDDTSFAVKTNKLVGLRLFTCLACGHDVWVEGNKVLNGDYRAVRERVLKQARELFEDDDEYK